jgi:benzoate membrane transport protein
MGSETQAQRRLLADMSVSTLTAGFVTVLVGLTSSIAIVFSGARALGADDAVLASWVGAICIGMGLLSLVPSWLLRVPVMVAYSTPGAVLLATLAPGDFTLAEGVGAFLICAATIAVVGFSGAFERLMRVIPVPVASALLAGLLTRFATLGFADASTMPALVVICTVVYLVMRRLAARFAVVTVLAVGVIVAIVDGAFAAEQLRWSIARPVFTAPSFSLAAFVGIAVPLFIVTMAGQNLPGVAAIRSGGYENDIPISTVVGATGATAFVLAPFGGYALNLSAITAAICMEPAAHEDRNRRYTASWFSGLLYLLIGVFGTSVVGALNAFPIELVHIIAGLALMPTIAAGIATSMSDVEHRDAAVLTFLVAVSGVTVLKIGSAFWAIVAGVVASLLTARRPPAHTPAT